MSTTTPSSAQETVRSLLAGAGDLPVLPENAMRILDEIRSPKASAARLAEFVSKDPVIASTVLRVANSALYGGRMEITDLTFAMTRIGLNHVRNLVLALVLRSKMADPQVYGPDGARLMEHSLAVAFGARLVADEAGVTADESFLCGLLHDFGKLALVKALREAEGIRQGELPEALQQIVEVHHPEAGALLAENWGLPAVVAATARWHHEPQGAGEHARMAAVVALADSLCHHLGLGSEPNDQIVPAELPVVTFLGLEADQVQEIAEHLPGLFETARNAIRG